MVAGVGCNTAMLHTCDIVGMLKKKVSQYYSLKPRLHMKERAATWPAASTDAGGLLPAAVPTPSVPSAITAKPSQGALTQVNACSAKLCACRSGHGKRKHSFHAHRLHSACLCTAAMTPCRSAGQCGLLHPLPQVQTTVPGRRLASRQTKMSLQLATLCGHVWQAGAVVALEVALAAAASSFVGGLTRQTKARRS
jgi:hypothetical protein